MRKGSGVIKLCFIPPAEKKVPEEEDSKRELRRLVGIDSGYDLEAYIFVQEALDFLLRGMEERRHVNGRELLEGLRRYALEEYGPLARIVLESWGVRRCEDFGRIVFHMVDKGIMRKTDQDSMEDFNGGYEFSQAFDQPFIPPAEAEES
jgi:uncharacterized repeat protein (TIGR04138 family)